MYTFHQLWVLSLAVILAIIALPGCQPTQPETTTEVQQTDGTEPSGEPRSDQGERASATGDPSLGPGVKLMAGGEPIDVEIGHLVPCVSDWNSDGKKDLLVGQFKSGAIRLYLNQGTDAAPMFKDFSMLHAGGKPIRLDAG